MKASTDPTSDNNSSSNNIIAKDKEYEIQIPKEIKDMGKLLGATYLEFGVSQCVAAYNERYLYFMEIVDGAAVRYSTFAIQNIVSIVSIIRGYMLITNAQRKIWLLQVKKAEIPEPSSSHPHPPLPQKQKNLQVQCFLKQTIFSSYFLREVTSNMIQLQIYAYNPGNTTKNLLIYQFTINQKVGVMGYTLDKAFKIVKQSRKQLYGSKIFFDPASNMIVRFKNFSDSFMVTKKISDDVDLPLHVFPICKIQEYYGLDKNCLLTNIENPSQKKTIPELKNINLGKSIAHLNYLLVETQNNKVCLMVVEEGMSFRILGFENRSYYWHIAAGGRLIGVSHEQSKIRITSQLNRKSDIIVGVNIQSQLGFGMTVVGNNEQNPFGGQQNQQRMMVEEIGAKNNKIQKVEKVEKVQKVEEKEKSKQKQKQKVQDKDEQKQEEEPKKQSPPTDQQTQEEKNDGNNNKQQQIIQQKKTSFKPAKIIGRKNVFVSNAKNQKSEPIPVPVPEPVPSSRNNKQDGKNQKQEKEEEKQEKTADSTKKEEKKQKSDSQVIKIKDQEEKSKQKQQVEIPIINNKQDQEEQQKEKEKEKEKEQKQEEKQEEKPLIKADEHQKKITIDNKDQNILKNEKNCQKQMDSQKKEDIAVEKQSKDEVIVPKEERQEPSGVTSQSNLFNKPPQGLFAPHQPHHFKFTTTSPSIKPPTVPYESIFKKSIPQIPHTANTSKMVSEENQKSATPYQIFPSPFMKKPSVDASQPSSEEKPNKTSATSINMNDESLPFPKKQQQQQQKKIQTKIIKVETQSEQSQKFYEDLVRKEITNFTEKLDNIQKNVNELSQSAQEQIKDLSINLKNYASQIHLLQPQIQQKMHKQLKNKAQTCISDYFSKNLTNKMNTYFKTVTNDSKNLFDSTLNFYINKKKQSVISMQSLFEQQEHLVNEIKIISADMMTSVQNTIYEGEETNAVLERKWSALTSGLEKKIEGNLEMLEVCQRNRQKQKKFQVIKDSLEEIKELLKSSVIDRERERQRERDYENQNEKKRNRIMKEERKVRKTATKKQANLNEKKKKISYYVEQPVQQKKKTKKKVKIVEDSRYLMPRLGQSYSCY